MCSTRPMLITATDANGIMRYSISV